MEVVNSNRKFKVYWMYNSAAMPDFLHYVDKISEEEMKEMLTMPLKKQVEIWNKKLPQSKFENAGDVSVDTTWCFIAEEGKVVAHANVTRYYKDVDDRDKARKFALGKVLKSFYPEDKFSRTLFWEAYMARTAQPVPAMKAVKGGVIPVKVGTKGSVMSPELGK